MDKHGSPRLPIPCFPLQFSPFAKTFDYCTTIRSQKLARLMARYLCLSLLPGIFPVRFMSSKPFYGIMYSNNFRCLSLIHVISVLFVVIFVTLSRCSYNKNLSIFSLEPHFCGLSFSLHPWGYRPVFTAI